MTDRTRRTLLQSLGLVGLVGLTSALTACTTDRQPERVTQPDGTTPSSRPSPTSRVLVAYFSRAGENYYYGDRTQLEVGNTAILVQMIADRIECDVHEIVAADPYPEDYEETVARNSREQDEDARPEIDGALPDLHQYDVIVLASPIWNVRPPMIMRTFAEALDFTGKKVHPVTTHAMSGLGTAEQDYAESCRGATLVEGLAVRGEEVRDHGASIDGWLTRTNLT